MNRNQPGRPRRPTGFTLVELLVVIGIIVVLIGILIPVVANVRKSSYVTSSKAQLSRIQYAIQSYYNEFQGYPGALSFADMAPPSSTRIASVGSGQVSDLTATEDLYLSLCGGWGATGTPVQLTFRPETLGTGVVTYNSNAAANQRKRPFMEHRQGDSTPPNAAGTYVQIKEIDDLDMPYAVDTAIPEFMDQFPSPRPVLYFRANPAARSTTSYNEVLTTHHQSFNPNAAYNFGGAAGYSNMNGNNPPTDVKRRDWAGQAPKGALSEDMRKRFASSTSSTAASGTKVARYAGTFMLIGAGADRVYGTDDDLIVGGGGG